MTGWGKTRLLGMRGYPDQVRAGPRMTGWGIACDGCCGARRTVHARWVCDDGNVGRALGRLSGRKRCRGIPLVSLDPTLSRRIPPNPGESRMKLMSRRISLPSQGVLSIRTLPRVVMPALVAGIHVFAPGMAGAEDMDARNTPGFDPGAAHDVRGGALIISLRRRAFAPLTWLRAFGAARGRPLRAAAQPGPVQGRRLVWGPARRWA